MKPVPLASVSALSLLCCIPLSAQTVRGHVLDVSDGSAVAGVSLRLIDGSDRAVSSTLATDSGTFVLRAPSAGSYWIAFEHLTYGASRLGPVALVGDSVTTVTLRLAPKVLPLNALTVEIERRDPRLDGLGFYDRRKAGEGIFIDRQIIEGRANRTLADVLGRARGGGTRVFNAGSGKDIQFGNSRPLCLPTIYLNGVIVAESDRRTPLNGPPRFDLDAIPADDIEALELYPGSAEVPLEFGGTVAPCGALLIWTRAE